MASTAIPGVSAAAPAQPLAESFFRVWIPTLVVALFIITFVVQPFDIPSPSMTNTLLVGDHLLVDRVRLAPAAKWAGPLLPYRPLEHADIVVFMSVVDPGLHLVKRLVGLPGDHIKLVHGQVVRNGVPLAEPYTLHERPYDTARDDWPNGGSLEETTPEWLAAQGQYIHEGELVVPPGNYFVMGDNRDDSFDSRYWGFVPQSHLIGRPSLVYWSYAYPDGESESQPSGLMDRLGDLLSVLVHAPLRTRWSRTLHWVR